jgi:hypothetical protein
MGTRMRCRIDDFKRPLKRLVVIARHLGNHQRRTPRPNCHPTKMHFYVL